MEMSNIYKQLTNVDIEQQKQLWDERGKGYYGEYLVFCELYKSIQGNCKILMNLNVPVSESKTTEIDLILIHETGLYVFEIKHYKGTIYGKNTDAIWTQYFRTVKNSTFKNPVAQNKYHIDALSRLFPNIPLHSLVVFTSPDCNVRIENSDDDVDICQLHNVPIVISERFSKSDNRFSMEDIDNIFMQLSKYSQMQETVTIDVKDADFFSWVQPVISKLEEKKREVEEVKKNYIANTEKLKKTKTKCVIINIVVALICVIMSFVVVINTVNKYDNELKKLKENLTYIDKTGIEHVGVLDSYVNVSNVSIIPLSDNSVSFSARLTIENDIYGIALTEKSRYIMITTAGKTIECDVFGEHLKYNRSENILGKGIRSSGNLAKIKIKDVSDVNEILQIKVTGVELFELENRNFVVMDELEIELYSKQM